MRIEIKRELADTARTLTQVIEHSMDRVAALAGRATSAEVRQLTPYLIALYSLHAEAASIEDDIAHEGEDEVQR